MMGKQTRKRPSLLALYLKYQYPLRLQTMLVPYRANARFQSSKQTSNQRGGGRMSLSLLRRRIRAGWYQDDLRSEQANRLIFLRWLAREGLLNEWDGVEE
jgi:hypothetical protein